MYVVGSALVVLCYLHAYPFEPSAYSRRAKQCAQHWRLFIYIGLAVALCGITQIDVVLGMQAGCRIFYLIFIWTVRINRRWINSFFCLLCRKSAPKFLLDVYKQLNDEANEGSGRYARSADSDEGENFITDIDKRAIEQSDIIMTFLNQSKFLPKNVYQIKRIKLIKFVLVSQSITFRRCDMNVVENSTLTYRKWQRTQH